jgi:uncharacterized protein YmfQ (DUF2313 family)
VGLTATDYRRQLQALLPLGHAWPRDEDATLTLFLGAVAKELSRIDARGGNLVQEADPRNTSELLADWERVAGLPDNCSGELSPTFQGRRDDLVSKLTSTGGQSRQYYIDVARALGFEITVEEPKPFRVGSSRVGDALTNGDWVHTWRVRAPETTIRRFRVGQSCVGEPLASWGNDGLECRIRGLAPAQTTVMFAYGSTLPAPMMLQEGGALLGQSGGAILLEEP